VNTPPRPVRLAATGDAQPVCPLGVCDGSGWILGPEDVARPCECRARRAAKRRARGVASAIPRKYQGVSLDRPPVSDMARHPGRAPVYDAVKEFIEAIDERLDEGAGIWLMGDVGTGKTTLAMLISSAALNAGHTVAIYSLPRLLAEIRGTFDSDTQGAYTALLDRLTEVDLLHIDDLGAEKTSAWVLEQLYSIVNARYEAEKSVIITTNLQRDALSEQIGERTVSRLEEMCEILPLTGADKRKVVIGDLREGPAADLRLA
jgi:DNA replication protein DnaC